ncbi:uncharacterized protein F5Z01DRAFT_79499 [Emericellopsis atlantica]|uniref:Uncharacterized protein n=1 Tax=Emericellopsis atlantica TaxID=2614577 RepID=A0A9P8CPU5_9HYPO|nr:uncharacterized protein F5Z01DRAFT_79499 [Emericellopsis atlantica]KAG9254562.1 hypothetical protein F5Z01DRAFT_79499 [Emericellopsis atlantica]
MRRPSSTPSSRLLLSLLLLQTLAAAASDLAARRRIPPDQSPNDAALLLLLPRFLLDASLPVLRARADACGDDRHSCEEIGHADTCCANDRYCYVNRDGDPKCCPIGSNCAGDSPCSSDAWYCTRTQALTTASDGEATPVPVAGCCPRKCPATSRYLCPEDQGGKCCPYDAECRAGNCVETAKPSASRILTPIQEGCTTRQYKCEDGQGCCDDDQRCTAVDGTGYCAPGRPSQSGIEIIGEGDDEGGSLSDGATAGIAAGVVIGAALVLGVLAWVCIRKRRERRARTVQGDSGPRDATDMSETTAAAAAVRPGHNSNNHGPTQEYFGSHPAAGPYTEEGLQDQTPGSQAASPPLTHQRAVPRQPQEPGDIAAPVEMDSETRSDATRSPVFGVSPTTYYGQHREGEETIDGRFELYGSYEPEPPPPRSPSIMATPVGYKPRKDDEH